MINYKRIIFQLGQIRTAYESKTGDYAIPIHSSEDNMLHEVYNELYDNKLTQDQRAIERDSFGRKPGRGIRDAIVRVRG